MSGAPENARVGVMTSLDLTSANTAVTSVHWLGSEKELGVFGNTARVVRMPGLAPKALATLAGPVSPRGVMATPWIRSLQALFPPSQSTGDQYALHFAARAGVNGLSAPAKAVASRTMTVLTKLTCLILGTPRWRRVMYTRHLHRVYFGRRAAYRNNAVGDD